MAVTVKSNVFEKTGVSQSKKVSFNAKYSERRLWLIKIG